MRYDELFARRGVVSVGIGFKYVGGKRTNEVGVVVGVEKKLPTREVPLMDLIPLSYGGRPTDVIQVGKIRAYENTSLERPCPGGFSCGNEMVTAGTLGIWVRKGGKDMILSNNHVLAASNEAAIRSPILQPGPYDGGSLVNRIATLSEYVKINFVGEGEGCAIPGLGAVSNFFRSLSTRGQEVTQPNPNLVDAALAEVVDPADVDRTIFGIGQPVDTASPGLGDRVKKQGRTTELTVGSVDQINVQVQVQYGETKVAMFDDQVVIRGDNGSEFSAPGDSGSAVVSENGRFLVGLLFAGGEGTTIINRIGYVEELLGWKL
jgi:hypothetical protein